MFNYVADTEVKMDNNFVASKLTKTVVDALTVAIDEIESRLVRTSNPSNFAATQTQLKQFKDLYLNIQNNNMDISLKSRDE